MHEHEGHTHHHGSHTHQHGTHNHTEKEEQIALLSYMVSHNKSHAEEVHEMSHSVQGDAAQLLHEAVELYNEGTEKLAAALNIIKGE